MQHESNKVVVKQGTLLPQKASSSITGVKNDEKKCMLSTPADPPKIIALELR